MNYYSTKNQVQDFLINVPINKYIFGISLIILGSIINVFPHYILDWNISSFASIILYTLSIILILGIDKLKLLLKPMEGNKFLVIIKTMMLVIFLRILVIILFFIIFHPTSTLMPLQNNFFQEHDLLSFAIDFTLIIIVGAGEELLMASIMLPLLFYLKDFKHNWMIANIICVFIFSAMHISVYNGNFLMCISIGVTRYAFTYGWKISNSLRGGIYAHTLFNMSVMLLDIF